MQENYIYTRDFLRITSIALSTNSQILGIRYQNKVYLWKDMTYWKILVNLHKPVIIVKIQFNILRQNIKTEQHTM